MMHHSGYTLLEVLIATAVLVLGLAAVFGASKSAQQRAAASAELTDIQLACQSAINELLVQPQPIQSGLSLNIEGLPDWKIIVECYPSPQKGLVVLHLSAQQFLPVSNIPLGIRYQLLRWIPEERIRSETQSDSINEVNEFEDLFQ
jgi:prepilin-type N-terminal cleavage/methylation domain-containing protein